MKPLDLQINLQNSYESARVESVRLEKPLLQVKHANDQAQKTSEHNRESVVAVDQPENLSFAGDKFDAEADWLTQNEKQTSGKSAQQNQKKDKKPLAVEPEKNLEDEKKSAHHFDAMA